MIKINRQAADAFHISTVKPAGDRVLRRIGLAILVFCLAFMPAHDGFAKARKNQGKQASTENNKYASIVIDAATGTVISEKNANKVLHPASLTKVMTLMLLFDALENGNVRLNDRIYISKHAASQQPSKLGLSAGSSIRVEDAILSIVTKSANDMSVAVAEHIAGSESRFAARMTQRAHSIGMSRTNFANASGLHNPAQVSTARDMATLARYIIVRYPNYYRYFGTKQFTYRGKTMTNHNRLMQSYAGMDGFKTGFINASGFNLIASAKHGENRLIGVVFGGKSWKSRNDHMASLLDAGFVKARSGTMIASAKSAPVQVAAATPVTPPPAPAIKPVYRETKGGTAPVTSLSAMNAEPRRLVLPPAAIPQAQPSVTDQAIANAESAINRGEYSDITGQGDYDAINAKRVETGLIAAAVYKGDHERVRQIQAAAASIAPQAGMPNARQNVLRLPEGVTPVSVPPSNAGPLVPAQSSLWSVQIGAYNSRVATDDALRYAHTKLPHTLQHASPIVVPLATNGGVLFRARFGNLTQAQAIEACRYFRDCLPVAPR
jgi:D-alanyl-D-alanine carboxypeptidase